MTSDGDGKSADTRYGCEFVGLPSYRVNSTVMEAIRCAQAPIEVISSESTAGVKGASLEQCIQIGFRLISVITADHLHRKQIDNACPKQADADLKQSFLKQADVGPQSPQISFQVTPPNPRPPNKI